MTTILLKRGNTAENDAYTGPEGEITLDTEAKQLRIHDGVTAGGTVVGSGGTPAPSESLVLIDTVTELPVTFQCIDGQFQKI